MSRTPLGAREMHCRSRDKGAEPRQRLISPTMPNQNIIWIDCIPQGLSQGDAGKVVGSASPGGCQMVLLSCSEKINTSWNGWNCCVKIPFLPK